MLPEQQQRILGYFIEEAKEHLTTIEQGLLNLQGTLNDPETLNEVFRAAHSVKGGAAMLGLSSIQRTAHRLEDCFKVLKEQSVKVDQKLETLFLNVFDTLAALLEHLQGPFGLTEEVANNLMSEAEPYFQFLHEHLDMLVKQGDDLGASHVPTSGFGDATSHRQTATPTTTTASYGRQQLQTQVLKTLRQMLQLFKQTATPDNRQELQDCCQHLVELGEELDLVKWSSLCLTAKAAIANPENSYLILAKVVITSIKQALELVLADQETEIVPREQLEALVGSPDIELLEVAATQENEETISPVAIPQPSTSVSNIENTATAAPIIEAEDVEPQNNIHSLSELFSQEDDKDEEDPFPMDKNLHVSGPEVGSTELNTLANLFADDNPELDDSYQEEQLLHLDSDDNEFQLDLNNSNTTENDSDLVDLLFFDTPTNNEINPSENTTEDLTLVQLFGDNLLDNENPASIDQEVDTSEDISLDNYHELEASTDDLITEEIKTLDDINDLLELEHQEVIPSWESLTQEDSSFDSLFPDTNEDETKQTINQSKDEIDQEDIAQSLEENLFATAESGEFSREYQTENDTNNDSPQLNIDEQPDINDDLSTLESTIFPEFEIEENIPDSQIIDDLPALDLPIAQEVEIEENSPDSQIIDDLPALDLPIAQEVEIEENSPDSQIIDDLPALDLPIAQEVETEENSEDIDDFSNIETATIEEVLLSDAPSQTADTSENFQIDLINDDADILSGEFTQELFAEQTIDSDELIAVADNSGDNVQVTTTEAETIENQASDLPATTTNEIVENISTTNGDDFADLEALINEDTAPGSHDVNHDNGEAEFADLEALLDFNIPEETSQGANAPQEEVTSDTPESIIDDTFADGFKDLEEMLKASVPLKTADSPKRNSSSRISRFEQLMKVPVKHLDDMSNLVGELVVNRNTLEQDQERLRQSLDNLLHQVQQLSDVGARMQELYEHSLLEASLLASRKNNGSPASEETDRGFTELEIDRFTPFHTLSQEMIELIVRVRESSSDIDFVIEETEQVARQFRQVTTQLQEGLTRSRMEPFSIATDMLPRGVRDNAIKSGKQVQLNIQGRDTLIDKMILEHLGNPLNHLLNNAIAHGIEIPEERIAAGKDETGTINVSAFHQGNQTVISVSDDGAGINPAKVKAKALKMGLITPEEAKTLSPTDTYELLFHPGFSTKDKADMLGGRGVGMDVVRTKIGEIRGIINVDSIIGQGTTFTIRLPLTLSICKALFCVSDKARIAFPMDGVEDTLDVHPKHVQYSPDGQAFITWHDTKLPFKPLKELLTFNRQLSRGNVYGGNRDDEMISAIIVRAASNLLALEVDQVLNEQEIAIKQFEGPAPKPIGVAGATVLGDGRIMPIVDVLEIMDIFQGRTSKQSGVSSFWEQNSPLIDLEPAETKSDPTVLIVDDSITVRELLSLSFNKAGYRVEQARDGQEAWDKLRSGLPCDLVFCDIEMPRCDGLELLSRIQKDPELQNLPIAMLTSRGADKHRQMAIQLGASGYFTKPYLEEALLEAASRMLKGEKLVGAS